MEMMAYQFSRLPYPDSLNLLEADIQHANALLVSFLFTTSLSAHFNIFSSSNYVWLKFILWKLKKKEIGLCVKNKFWLD